MKPHRIGPVLTFLVVLAASCASAAVPTGYLTAASVEATGASRTTAHLAALFIERPAPAAFTLDADHLTAKNHHANLTLALGSRYNIEGEPRTLHDGPGSLTGHDSRSTARFWIVPLTGRVPPTITLSAPDCVALEPPSDDNLTRRTKVNSAQPVLHIDTKDAAAWTTCREATATVEGDFLLVLWERDADLTTPDGTTTTLRTGHHDAAPGTPTSGVVGTADELFVTVYGGTLALPLTPEAHDVYLHAASVEADSWRFTDAAGTLPRVVDAVTGTVDVKGALAANITGGPAQLLRVAVEGIPTTVAVNGQDVAVVAPAAPGASQISVQAWLAVGVVAAGFTVAVAVWLARRRSSAAPAVEAEASEAAPARSAARRDREAEARVVATVEASPGVWVREFLASVGVSKERAYRALKALLADGGVVAVTEAGKRHLFIPSPDLERTWQRDAARRNSDLGQLLSWVEANPNASWSAVLDAASAWRWPESTTRDRLRRLVDAGLVVRRGSARRGTFIVPAHGPEQFPRQRLARDG